MRHRVAGRVQTFQFHGSADADHVALGEPAIHAADASWRHRHGPAPSRAVAPTRPVVAPRMVTVLVRVEDLGDRPALGAGRVETELPFERIDRERLTALRTSDQVVKIAVRVARPDSFDQHDEEPHGIAGSPYPECFRRAIMSPPHDPGSTSG